MSNVNDKEYADYLVRLSSRFKSNTKGEPVFTTNYDSDKLWKLYLSSFSNPQYHNCFACRSFLNRYAGLVIIDINGNQLSAMWDEGDVPRGDSELRDAVRRIRLMVEGAKVSGVFYSDEQVLGHEAANGWRHLHLFNSNLFKPISRDSKGLPRSPSQEAAERQVDFTNIYRACKEFSPAVVAKALEILDAKELYRSEKVRAPAVWLGDLHELLDRYAGKEEDIRRRIVWRAIATAPVGFARPRSRMVGTLLEDIAAGLSLKDIKARFDAKMDPSNYGHSQAAPTEQQIEIAEAAVEALGIAPAFERRYTDLYDVASSGATVWSPKTVIVERPRRAGKASGVFSDLRPTPKEDPFDNITPAKKVTWEKFAREVLPGAAKIQYRVPQVGRFGALTTAADSKAPPILQWDSPDNRNPVAWSFPNPPARADEWNLKAGELVSVQSIVQSPNLWNDAKADQHGKGVFLLLECARDMRDLPGGGLFVEHLRNDLKPHRRTIEAHLNKQKVHMPDNVCAFGVGLFADQEWSELGAPQLPKSVAANGPAPDYIHALLVVDDSGSMGRYLGPARSALRHLIDSLGAMPGKVDVTVLKFGNYVTTILNEVPLYSVGKVENQISANSGSTALNDAIGRAIELGRLMRKQNASFFLGIVTDGEENHSSQFNTNTLREQIEYVLATGNWTIAYAGAGRDPLSYAREVGIPEGNATVFEASARGFEDIGHRYATSTRDLAAAYKSGARATKSFFGAASGRQTLGNDLPTLLVTTLSGEQRAYKLDRWE